MRIGRSKARNISELTIDANVAMATHKLTGLGAPAAQNDSLRYGQAEIRTNEIAADAAILLTQLEDAVCSETEAATLIATHASLITGIHGLTTVQKTADQVVNNSITLANDDHLLFTIGASEIWEVFLYLIASAPSPTPDMKLNWALPTGGVKYSLAFDTAAAAADADVSLETISTVQLFIVHCLLINSTTAGNAQLQWAQKVATEEDTTLKANSFIVARRLL